VLLIIHNRKKRRDLIMAEYWKYLNLLVLASYEGLNLFFSPCYETNPFTDQVLPSKKLFLLLLVVTCKEEVLP
jgi:hypothetical protein